MGLPKSIGSFEIVRLLGAGGMGEVFLARDPDLDRYVAIKRLLNHQATPRERRERFRREAKIAARLDHPAIVRIYGMLDDDDSQCIVMEYVKGKNLRQFMNKRRLSIAQVVSLAYRIAEGMAEAHDHSIVHRDLKSENVLITRTGQVKITDFGIAKMLDEDTMTAEGALVGTYRAMSPEQVLGKSVDRRSDMFSFGTLLYECLSGQTPFQADTPFVTLQRIVHGKHRPLSELVADLPPALESLIDQLLAKEPLHRPRDFHDILAALVDIRNDVLGHACHGSVMPEGHPPLLGFDDTATGDGDGDTGEDGSGAGEVDAARGHLPEDMGSGLLETLARARRAATVESGSSKRDVRAARADESAPWTGHKRSIAALAGTAALGVAGYLLGAGLAKPPVSAPPVRVAILEPTVAGGPPGQQLLIRDVVRDYLGRAVSAVQGVEVERHYLVEQAWDHLRGETPQGEKTPMARSMTRLAEALNVSDVLTAHVRCDDELSCEVTVKRALGDATALAAMEVRGRFVMDPPRHSIESALGDVLRDRFYPDRKTNGLVEPTRQTNDPHLQLETIKNALYQPAIQRDLGTIREQLNALRDQTGGFLGLDDFEAELFRMRGTEENHRSYYKKASERCDSALAATPDSAQIMARCIATRVANNVREEPSLLGQLAAEHPHSRWTHLAQGIWTARKKNKDLAKARRHLDRAEFLEPAWSTLVILINVLIEQGDLEIAAQKFEELWAMRPDYGAVMYLRGKLAFMRGDMPCAARYLQQLTGKSGGSYYSCMYLGQARQLLGHYTSAAAAYGCASSKSKRENARFNRAENLKAAGDNTNAGNEFRQIAAMPSTKPWMKLAVAAYLVAIDEPERRPEVLAMIERRAQEARTLDDRSKYYIATSYALLQEYGRARTFVDRLYKDGVYRVEYFRFPWFKEVRKDLALDEPLRTRFADSTCFQPTAVTGQ